MGILDTTEQLCAMGLVSPGDIGLEGMALAAAAAAAADDGKLAIVVTDPISTGALMVAEMQERGVAVIAAWSDSCGGAMRSHVPLMASGIEYTAIVEEAARDAAAVAREVKALVKERRLRLVACVAGAETGVRFQDALADALELRGNGVATSAQRRDKHAQQEAVRRAGMRAVRQALCTSWEDVSAFLDAERDAAAGSVGGDANACDIVLKPVESAGSDGVKRVRSRDEAKAHFEDLFGVENQCGCVNESVLAQEFLSGAEYVIDHVSRDGTHTTAGVWTYDKRIVNGVSAPIVYFGQRMVDPTSPLARELVAYARGVLDAIGLLEGPSHGEVIMTASGPCLVEMNCRAHGANGTWLPTARASIGRGTQVALAVDALLRGHAVAAGSAAAEATEAAAAAREPKSDDFLAQPGFLRAARMVFLVSHFAGRIAATPGYDAIHALPSFAEDELHLRVGDDLARSVDVCSIAGMVSLAHDDAAQVERDYEAIRALEAKPGALWRLKDDGGAAGATDESAGAGATATGECE